MKHLFRLFFGVCVIVLSACSAKKPVQVKLQGRTCMQGSYPFVAMYKGQPTTVCAIVDPKTHQVVDIVDVGYRPGDGDEDDQVPVKKGKKSKDDDD